MSTDNRHIDPTQLDDLIDVDDRSLISLGDSVVVSIPSAVDLGLDDLTNETDACVSVRLIDGEIIATVRIPLND